MTILLTLEAALKERIPAEQHGNIPFLVDVINQVIHGERAQARDTITESDDLRNALGYLSGSSVIHQSSVISFGKEGQFGDITIAGGVAGGDVINLSFALNGEDVTPDYSDPDLLRRRRDAYEVLFRILKVFAKYDVPLPLSTSLLQNVTTEMRDWYFDFGGLYMSEYSRIPYFELKDTIKGLLKDPKYRLVDQIAAEDTAYVTAKASSLRDSLRRDIRSTK
jgi:hypothetical protein